MPSVPIAQVAPVAGMQLFSRNLSLSAGTFCIEPGERVVGPMRRGLKIGVMLDGRQSLAVDDQPPVTIDGPALLIAANSGDHQQRRVGLSGGQQRCVLMQFNLDFIAREFGVALERLLEGSVRRDAGLWVRPAAPAMRSVAVQMAQASAADPLRGLFLAGKALELAALALGEAMVEPRSQAVRLPARTRERVMAARDLLLDTAQNPPTLAELARLSGLNPTRLTSAFRAEFGTTVFGYLQEHRLRQAHALIASGETTVAEAAFRVGYTPAHFSGLFRKRFGLPPSALR